MIIKLLSTEILLGTIKHDNWTLTQNQEVIATMSFAYESIIPPVITPKAEKFSFNMFLFHHVSQ